MSKVNFLQNKSSLYSLLFLQLEGEKTLKCCNDHGHMQKCNFLEYQFWANLVQKNQNCQFNKFGTKPKPDMQNSIVI